MAVRSAAMLYRVLPLLRCVLRAACVLKDESQRATAAACDARAAHHVTGSGNAATHLAPHLARFWPSTSPAGGKRALQYTELTAADWRVCVS